MSTNKQTSDEFVRIDLTESQKEQVKHVTGKDVESIELQVTELEERIAPRPLVLE
jgi:hypothetical protein